jgi:Ca-activated chloride channel family protein
MAARGEGEAMRFLSPWYLLLLMAIPPLVWLSIKYLKRASGPRSSATGEPDPELSPLRRRLFIVMRVAALSMLVLALAGPAVSRVANGLSVAFLLDESESVTDASRERAVSMIESIRSRLSKDDRAVLVRFGGNEEVEELVPGKPVSLEVGDAVDRGSTDIAGAVQFTLAQLPEQGTRKIVLFTDGNENRGKSAEAAALARSFGVSLFTVPLAPSPSQSEVSVESIVAPDRVRSGEPHEVTLLIKSRIRTAARVSLLRDGEPIGVKEGFLEAGENSIAIKSVLAEPGVHSYEALVEASDDQFLENNHFKRFIEVTGAPAVLYVSKRGERSSALLAALTAQGISVVPRDAAELPGALEGFVPYDGIILDNVPGFSLSYEKMQMIEEYVRDVGGGLLMIGGDTSFGAGGYYKTPIERLLPVDMDVKSQVQMPRLSLVILADKSGSMSALVPTGESKLDVVKSAAYEAIQLLNPFDKVGLLAFDADWEWTVPITEARNKDEVAKQLAMLSPGGGTIMFQALREAHRAIAETASAMKHVIIISDGLSEPGEFQSEVQAMAREKITVSTVAVGEDSDRELLSKIAQWGGGRFYATNDPTAVPRIFVTETMLVSRGLLVEKRFLPHVSSMTEILRGIPLGGIPPLDGFVFTYLKNGAEESLGALYDAPLLASWRYGLGKAAAFTSDLKGKWGRAWVGWDAYSRFSAQLVRWIQRPVSFDVMHPVIRLSAGTGRISVDAYDELSAFVNGMDMRAVILGPGEERQEVRLPQKAPGLYEGSFTAEKMGDYSVTLAAVNRQDLSPRTIGVSLSYPDEYRDIGVNTELLSSLAASAGGKLLPLTKDVGASASRSAASAQSAAPQAAAPGYQELFRRDSRRVVESSPLWPLLVLLALLAFFIDIAARKLVLPEGMRARLAALFTRRSPREDYSYQDLTRMISSAKEVEKKKLRERISYVTGQGKVDPDLAAYLYIARLKGKTREK